MFAIIAGRAPPHFFRAARNNIRPGPAEQIFPVREAGQKRSAGLAFTSGLAGARLELDSVETFTQDEAKQRMARWLA